MRMLPQFLPADLAGSIFDLGSANLGSPMEGALKWETAVRWMESALPPLQRGASIVVIFWISVLLPISIFRRTHSAIASTLRISSLCIGVVCCWQAFIVTYRMLGWLAAAIGILCAGVGVVPMALFVTAVKEDWNLFGNILIGVGLTVFPRLLAKALTNRAPRMPVIIRGVRYYDDDYNV